MGITTHLTNFKDLYLIVLSWPILGFILPAPVVAIWCVVTFLIILRTGNFTKAFLALMVTLLFSDSYLIPLSFAATAKIGSILILLIYILSNFDQFKLFNNKVFLYFLPFLAYAVLASSWSTEPFTALQKSVSYGIVFFCIPLLFQRALSQNPDFKRDLICGYGVFLFAGIGLWLISPDAGTLAGRFRGLMGNPNGMGTLSTVLVIMVFILHREQKNAPRIDNQTWAFFLVSTGISLFLCGSRTALFAIILFFVFNRLRYFTNFGTLALFVGILLSYNYILTNLPIIITALGLEEYLRLDTLEEGSGRFIAWNFAWEQIQYNYFIGGGFGYTEYIYKEFYHYLSQLGHQGNAHNSYLTLWLDTGLVGILLYALGFMRSVFVASKASFFAFPVFYAILFSANFESWLAASLNPFTSLFLISLVLLLQQKDLQMESDEEAQDLSELDEKLASA